MTAVSRSTRSTPVSVLVVRIALVVGTCVLIGVLPSLYTGESTEILSYTAPKEETRKAPAASVAQAERGRLWGVIVPLKSDFWFFKLTGPSEEVSQLDPQLHEFLQSVDFARGEPKWKLPAGWTQRPGDQIRYATIVIPTEKKPLELTVTTFGRASRSLEDQLLDNVNRWRGQATLPPVTLEDLPTSTERVIVAGVESTLVNLEGVLKSNPMGRGPFSQR